MERFEDQAIVLRVRPHGENGAVVHILAAENGLHAGYVRGVHSAKMRGVLEPGNTVSVDWQSRVADQLGFFTFELLANPAAVLLGDKMRLSALQSACALCVDVLPERERHSGVYHGLQALLQTLAGPVWGQAYVMWELALLREMGFALDLTTCAGGGDPATLAYVSPKTGRAVSEAMAGSYKARLLPLPDFLRPAAARRPLTDETAQDAGGHALEALHQGLMLSGYFLEHWAFAHHTRGLPEARTRLQARVAALLAADPALSQAC